MARILYGGSPADVTTDAEGRVVPNAPVSVWTQRVGGTEVTDLLDVDGNPVTVLRSDDSGVVFFAGPEGVDGTLWLQASALSPRLLVRPVTLTASGGPGLPDGSDVDDVLAWDGSAWVPSRLAADAAAAAATADVKAAGAQVAADGAVSDAAAAAAAATAAQTTADGAQTTADGAVTDAAAAAAAAAIADGKADAAQTTADQGVTDAAAAQAVAELALPRGAFAGADAEDVRIAATVTLTEGQTFPAVGESKAGDLHQNTEQTWATYSQPDGRAAAVVWDRVGVDGTRNHTGSVAVTRNGELFAGAFEQGPFVPGPTPPFPDGTPLLDARFNSIQGIYDDGANGLLIADTGNQSLYRAHNGVITRVYAGRCNAVAVHKGDIYVATGQAGRSIVRVNGDGTTTTVAGDGTNAYTFGALPGALAWPYLMGSHPDGLLVLALRGLVSGKRQASLILVNLTDSTLEPLFDFTYSNLNSVWNLTTFTIPDPGGARGVGAAAITVELANGQRIVGVPQSGLSVEADGWQMLATSNQVGALTALAQDAAQTAGNALPRYGGIVTGGLEVRGKFRVGTPTQAGLTLPIGSTRAVTLDELKAAAASSADFADFKAKINAL